MMQNQIVIVSSLVEELEATIDRVNENAERSARGTSIECQKRAFNAELRAAQKQNQALCVALEDVKGQLKQQADKDEHLRFLESQLTERKNQLKTLTAEVNGQTKLLDVRLKDLKQKRDETQPLLIQVALLEKNVLAERKSYQESQRQQKQIGPS